MLHIDNIRLGFACNSSSSHSIIMGKDSLARYNDYCKGDGFGWGYFTASDCTSRAIYLTSVLSYSDYEDEVIESLTGMKTSLKYNSIDDYIDHDSMVTISKDAPMEWLNEFADYFIGNDNIAILGGNDNDECTHALVDIGESCDWLFSSHAGKLRHDGDYWIQFSEYSGNKIRYSFNSNSKYTKASIPELVDVKLTDYCETGCSYCYQGSTIEGKHALTSDVKSIIDSLSEMGVFEIAFGGGEPTTHTDFLDILKYSKSKGVIPNFTTRNISWIEDKNVATEILNTIGAIAFSVSSMKEVVAVNKHFDTEMTPKTWKYKGKLAEFHRKITFQYVVGTSSDKELLAMMKFCKDNNYRLTLLGYKTTGFGAEWEKNVRIDQQLTWIDMAQKTGLLNAGIAIDTLLASQSIERMNELNVPKTLYHTTEGAYSCYIDAVSKRIAPSSYCDSDKYGAIDFTNLTASILSSYAKYPGEEMTNVLKKT